MMIFLRGLDMDNIEACPDKITRPVFQYDNLCVRMHVRLLDDKHQPYHTEYEYNGKLYAKIDAFSFLTFEIKNKENKGRNDMSGSIILTPTGLKQVLGFINDFIYAIYTEKIFAKKRNGEVVMYKDVAEKYSKEIRVVGGNGNMGVTPAVIYDNSTELTYEGGIIYINKRINQVALPITYLEGLYYTLDNVDIFRDSQLLLNYFITYYRPNEYFKSLINKGAESKKSRPKIDFTAGYTPGKSNNEFTESNYRPANESDQLFDGLEE